jgi:1,4-dihydroxy-6-naphthoate synthase
MIHQKIDTEGLTFTYILEDVETLNKMAKESTADVTKVSYGAVSSLINNYMILDAGGALGKGVGPLLISKTKPSEIPVDIVSTTIALPGINTTAHLLFNLAFPGAQHKFFMPFDHIEDAVLNEEVDLGVIIHENRFTYAAKGLYKIADLGDVWEKNTGLPIPLGGIMARRSFDQALRQKINRVIKKSIEFAFEHIEDLPPFVKQNAQEMDEAIMRKHIDLYVNEYSLGLGMNGRNAVMRLLEASEEFSNKKITNQLEIFAD